MDIYCLSASHQTASLDVREKLSCTPPKLNATLAYYLTHRERFLGLASEVALLATCNRFEVYAIISDDSHPFVEKEDDAYQALLAFIAEMAGFSAMELDPLFARYHNLDAAHHLFRVTAGLESQVLGETQILGQVSGALESALQAGSARHTLSSLFRAALHAAKRAHSETEIGKNPASLSSVAAAIAEQHLGAMPDCSILVIGAGEMGALAVKTFHLRGAQHITVVNRTWDRAARLSALFGCNARPWDELEPALQAADVVVSATGAQQPVLTLAMLRAVIAQRPNRPLLLLDLALPRNVDPAARALPGVRVFDLDDMKSGLNQTWQRRQRAAQQAEVILRVELRAFAHWVEVIPTVGKLHRKAEKIRLQELERTLQHLPDLDPQVREQIELLTRSLVKKLLHEPSSKIRSEAKNGQLEMYVDSLHFLFGLDEDDAQRPETKEQGKHG